MSLPKVSQNNLGHDRTSWKFVKRLSTKLKKGFEGGGGGEGWGVIGKFKRVIIIKKILQWYFISMHNKVKHIKPPKNCSHKYNLFIC
jgi:hypothetical protein